MNSQVNLIHVRIKQSDLRRRAAMPRRPQKVGDPAARPSFRLAGAEDASSVRRLAELEGVSIPAGDLLLAIVDDEALAMIPVAGGGAIANPFRPTAAVVEALVSARAHLRGEGRHGRPRRLGAVLGRLLDPAPSRGSRGPVVPGTEGRLIR